MTAKHPNIVLILADQQRMDSIGAYGSELAKTPVLDELAERGVRFRHAYTPCTVCSPARASVLTGLYPFQHGVTRNDADLQSGLPNLASSLLGAGYRLGYTGKWHIDPVYGPTHFGFHANDWLGYSHPAGGVYMNYFKDSRRYPVNHYLEYLKERDIDIPELEKTVYIPIREGAELYARQTGPVEASFEHYVAEEAIGLIESFTKGAKRGRQPFFLWANFWGPHDPYILPEPFFSMFTGDDVILSPSMEETWTGKPWIQKRMSTHYWGVEDMMNEGIYCEAVAKYAGYCAFLDWQTGRIIAKLEDLGILEDTVVVYSADHGSMIGHHKLIEKGPYPYDDIQRVPLIVAGPGVDSGLTYDDFVYLHDLTPTVLEWAGAEPIPTSNVQSLVPLMVNGTLREPRDDVYTVRHHHGFHCEQRFIRTRRYKYAYNALDIDELYDLEADPDEMINRIDDATCAKAKTDMRERMWRHMKDLSDPLSASFDVFARRRGRGSMFNES